MKGIIARAEAALEGVYEGPWHVAGFGNINADDATKPPIAKAWNTPNSEFIAAARTLVPELVAELKGARAERDEWRAQCEHAVAKWEELGASGGERR